MKPRDEILIRMYVVLTLLTVLPLFVAGRVVWLALAEGPALRAQGERQASSFVTIPAMRGAILDRAGRVLAVNAARYDVALDPEVPGFTEAVAGAFFDKLSQLTRQPASSFRRKVRQRSSPRYVQLLRGIGEQQKEEIERWGVPGLLLEPHFARRYNYGAVGAHVLGHVDADGRGIAGIELHYDDYLEGAPGRRAVKRDRRGIIKAFVGGQVVEPVHGQSVVLTLDLIRQTILEDELARGMEETGANWGAAVAMDPHTGAVLAMADAPTYDPNRPAAFPTGARRNHVVTDQIEPGSTFKLVAAVAAVERGLVSLDDSVDTGQGWAVFRGRTMHDTHAHGTITFADVIAQSSNVGVAKTAQRLDPGVFYQYARNLGFGQPTWVDLPGEVAGRLKKPSAWSGTSQTSMSIGYEVTATPLQLLAAYCALANGGLLVQPYLVAERRDITGRTLWAARQDSIRRVFKPATARALLPAFERVVQEGTARRAAVEGLRIAGKTGTAIKTIEGRYAPGAYRASFVGFFPADDPVVALIVVLDEPKRGGYGGLAAAPVFQRVAQRWIGTFPRVAEQMAPADSIAVPEAVPVPDVAGQPAAVAADRLLAAGHDVKWPDDLAALVVDQQPAPGAPVERSRLVRLTLAGDAAGTSAVMPDLKGLAARQAVFWLAAHGVQVKLEGSGSVVDQSPQAGAPLPERALLRCK